MPGCAADNCTNNAKKCRLFGFPANPERRTIWTQNMRRDNWQPTKNSRLCEHHFDQSQFENNRQDGWRKLKPNAVPTLFYKPQLPPKKLPEKINCSEQDEVQEVKENAIMFVVTEMNRSDHDNPIEPILDEKRKTRKQIKQMEQEIELWKNRYYQLAKSSKCIENAQSQRIKELKRQNQRLRKINAANQLFLNNASKTFFIT